VTIDLGFVESAAGSALISVGRTRVICTASVSESVPRWMMGRGKGWVTAEYAMLPASTGERKQRDIAKGKQDGRGVEIQRLIGRSLRVVVDFKALGERSVYVDCDVLEADGGTRCAAITGGFVALRQAFQGLVDRRAIEQLPLTGSVAAVSVGLVAGRALCDLDYAEDSQAEVDANVVMTGDGGLVEVQATAERTPLSRASLDELLALAEGGIGRLREVQERVVSGS
jgi:ribonuclease PH